MHTDFQSYGVEKTPILVEFMECVSDWQSRCDIAEQLTTAGRLPQLQQGFEDFMQEVDAIILPVHAYPAMKHGTTWQKRPGDEEIYAYLYFPNLCGPQFPAGTVRVGQTESGLPIGVQVIAAAYREDIVLRLLQEIETKFGGWQPPPL